MRGELTDKVRVFHVLEAIEEIEKYIEGVVYEDFTKNSEKKFATIKQIEIIGEACNRMSDLLKSKHPAVRWKEINGLETSPFMNISASTIESSGRWLKMICQF
jgi:uncharacterized protein with HEPN domain